MEINVGIEKDKLRSQERIKVERLNQIRNPKYRRKGEYGTESEKKLSLKKVVIVRLDQQKDSNEKWTAACA